MVAALSAHSWSPSMSSSGNDATQIVASLRTALIGHDPDLDPDEAWYSAWPHSGGLQGIGSHAIDQCRFMLGEIKSVSALVRTFNEDRAITSAESVEMEPSPGTGLHPDTGSWV